jgi:hypothetical protein
VFVVPSDDELVREAAAIVTGTARDSWSRQEPGRPIETVTRIEVTERIKGEGGGAVIEVVSLGGVVGDRGLLVPGAPVFADGEHVLLFLHRNGRGEWATRSMAVGKFTFRGSRLLRSHLCGFDRNGRDHIERERSAERFLGYVRETARGRRVDADYFLPAGRASADAVPATDGAPARTYALSFNNVPIRWSSFPTAVVFRSNGTQPNAAGGGLTAVQRGLSAWTNDDGSNIVYQYGGTTGATGGLRNSDGVHSILFNDPTGEITEAGVLAVGGVFFLTSVTHRHDGDTFIDVLEADLVIRRDLPLPGVGGPGFDRVVTHELGHTLSLRHSDEPPPGGSFSSTAIMTSTVDFHGDRVGSALQGWDRDAIGALYGTTGGPVGPPCDPPSIAVQPNSPTLTTGSVTLSVVAAGTGPLQYQWYAGSRGDTRTPVPSGTFPSVTVQPAQTTTYWVRVTGVCGAPADSAEATVTVNGCPGVVISSVSTSTSIIQGAAVTLSGAASGGSRTLTYRWFVGERGDRSVPAGTGESIVVAPQVTTRYWLEVSNDCGFAATSETVIVTVRPCTAPRVLIQPAPAEAILGGTVSLAATVDGTLPLTLQWFEGIAGDSTRPVVNAITASVTSPQITQPTRFWLLARNDCGEASTAAAEVSVASECRVPQIAVQPASSQIAPGATAILSVEATGPSLSYRWYIGPRFDFTSPVGVSAPHLATPPITEPTQFWVEIRNPCGTASSAVATVTPANGRRRAAGR